MKNRRYRPSPRRLSVEPLERRELLAVTPLVLSSETLSLPDPTEIVAMSDRLLFPRWTEANGNELWSVETTSDGTSVSELDLVEGWSGSYPRSLTTVGDKTFFIGEVPSTVGIARRQLYQTDGTAAGTVRLTAFRATAQGADHPLQEQSSLPLLVHGVLTLNTGVESRELWSQPFDGSAAVNLTAGFPAGADLGRYVVTDRFVLFEHHINHDFRSLWISDGSAAGTYQTTLEPVEGRNLDQFAKGTSEGVYTLERTSAFTTRELIYTSADGVSTVLFGPYANVNSSDFVPVSIIADTPNGPLVDAGPAGWWIALNYAFAPIEQSDKSVEVATAMSSFVVTFDATNTGQLQRIDRQTKTVSTPTWPLATLASSLQMFHGRLVYESRDGDNVRLIALDVDSGDVRELARYGVTDNATMTVLNENQSLLQIEKTDSRFIQRIDLDPANLFTITTLIEVEQSIAPVSVQDGFVLTYRNVADRQELVRVNMETGHVETLLSIEVPNALTFFTDVSSVNTRLNIGDGRALQYIHVSPSGIEELWLQRGDEMRREVRLPKGSSFYLFRTDDDHWFCWHRRLINVLLRH